MFHRWVVAGAFGVVGSVQACGSEVSGGDDGDSAGTATGTSTSTDTGTGGGSSTGSGTSMCEFDPGDCVAPDGVTPDPYCSFQGQCGTPTSTSVAGEFCFAEACGDEVANGLCPTFLAYYLEQHYSLGQSIWQCYGADQGPFLGGDGDRCCYLEATPVALTGTGTGTGTGTDTGTDT